MNPSPAPRDCGGYSLRLLPTATLIKSVFRAHEGVPGLRAAALEGAGALVEMILPLLATPVTNASRVPARQPRVGLAGAAPKADMTPLCGWNTDTYVPAAIFQFRDSMTPLDQRWPLFRLRLVTV